MISRCRCTVRGLDCSSLRTAVSSCESGTSFASLLTNALGTVVADDVPPISRLLFAFGLYVFNQRYGAGFGKSNSLGRNRLIIVKNDAIKRYYYKAMSQRNDSS